MSVERCYICKKDGWWCRASAPGTNYREVMAPLNQTGVRVFNSIEACRIVIEMKKKRELKQKGGAR